MANLKTKIDLHMFIIVYRNKKDVKFTNLSFLKKIRDPPPMRKKHLLRISVLSAERNFYHKVGPKRPVISIGTRNNSTDFGVKQPQGNPLIFVQL